jgi:hypothetical protein
MHNISIYPSSHNTTISITISISNEEVIMGSNKFANSFIKTDKSGLNTVELLNNGCSIKSESGIMKKAIALTRFSNVIISDAQ